jgi:hypothetical protein
MLVPVVADIVAAILLAVPASLRHDKFELDGRRIMLSQ